MAIRILVNGAAGRMGQQVVQAVTAATDLLLVGQADKQQNLADLIRKTTPDLVVDFTVASAVYDNVLTVIEAGVRAVVGTSGLLPEQITQLSQRCAERHLGAVIAPNFSLAAVLMMHCAQQIVPYLPNVEIVELHHETKQDSPSGTALRTAQMLADARIAPPPTSIAQHENVKGARGATFANIPIHALRLPGVIAEQQVIFGGQGETLTLMHQTLNRDSFMPGVLLACREVMQLDRLVVGLEHVLKLHK